ncbi:MAG: sulfite exporter TauE/SafE family protein [Verrucomicrobiae bacterium]|nr:sulfite exporter TauE/SafE family protein [Verrucomicrobiae bacterium]
MSLLYGAVVGLALGLTGGGGSIFAVPLLVFGLDLPLQTAIGISLAVVGAAACFGAVRHWRRRELDLRAGLVFAAGGMALAPLGTWIGRSVPGPWLLTGFALLMSSMAWRLWTGRGEEGADPGACAVRPGGGLGAGCYVRLTAGGAAAGLLSGLFGVGGGFLIVHGLMYVAGMALHRAVATSLMVIFLISLSGVASHMVHGLQFPPILTGLFLSGSLLGMVAGQGLRARLSGPTLRRVFAGAMWAVAALLLFRSLPDLGRAATPVEDAPGPVRSEASVVPSKPLCLQCHGTPGRELKHEDAERIRQL